jgi:multicomponent Na+:H+ antiporter subunit E
MREGPTRVESPQARSRRFPWRGRSVVLRLLLFSGGWWALTEGEGRLEKSLPFGLAVVLAALFASLALPADGLPQWRPLGLARLLFAFLTGSLSGGLDVARRALSPRLPLAPAIFAYRLRLPPGPGRSLFMSALSLMPGTLSADLEGEHLMVHVLVARGDVALRQLQALEAHVARAVGEELEATHA